MRQSYALFSRRLTPRLWIEDWGVYAPAPEAAAPDAPPLTQYTFRKGNLWQPTKFWLLPAPPEQAAPDAPPLTPYIFRRGGFWQIQKIWIDRSPIDAIPSVPDQPPLTQYAFRRGGLWRIQKSLPVPDVVVVVVPPPDLPPAPLPAPSPAHNTYIGSSGGFLAPERWRNFVRDTFGAVRLHQYDQAVALFVLGEITEEEYVAIVGAIREYLAS